MVALTFLALYLLDGMNGLLCSAGCVCLPLLNFTFDIIILCAYQMYLYTLFFGWNVVFLAFAFEWSIYLINMYVSKVYLSKHSVYILVCSTLFLMHVWYDSIYRVFSDIYYLHVWLSICFFSFIVFVVLNRSSFLFFICLILISLIFLKWPLIGPFVCMLCPSLIFWAFLKYFGPLSHT